MSAAPTLLDELLEDFQHFQHFAAQSTTTHHTHTPSNRFGNCCGNVLDELLGDVLGCFFVSYSSTKLATIHCVNSVAYC